MAMVASTVLYSMSSVSGWGPPLGKTCGEEGPSPASTRPDGKAASSERGGASFSSSEEADLPSSSSRCGGSRSSPASCSRDDDEENDDEDASIFSLGEESRFPEEAGPGSGVGGSCSVPGSIREDESRVSVSEVLADVSASWDSAFGSPQGGREEEAAQSGGGASPSLLTLRRFTGVAPSSSADRKTEKR